MLKKLFTAILILIALPVIANAAILVGYDDLTGSRTFLAGITATGGWNDSAGIKISWAITENETSYHYSYTFINAGDSALSPEASHMILEVSSLITADNVSDYIFNPNSTLTGPQTWTADPDSPNADCPGENKGNPNLPADIYGIKMDRGLATYIFDSAQAPMWGDFYVKSGNKKANKNSGTVTTAWNSGFGEDPAEDATDFTNWVPVPGSTPVPIPASSLLLGSGLLALIAIRRATKSKSISKYNF